MSLTATLAQRAVSRALEHELTLVTVESCTAGALACALSRADGASQVLHGGFVVYTKANKVAAVGVPWELLRTHTAVSGEVARAMAIGGLSRSPADIAITGVVGPEPDEDGNPVGLVHVATAVREGGHEIACDVEELRLAGTSDDIREQAMAAALDLALRLMSVTS